ncbi:LGFP repeat-containing protein [Corynebacterium halotolerans]|uniref:Secreted protein n=1 Tax=Corynebacterium halotolerans YIM 70093 = DSM 44683 TaxID=1121362 RepID=M1NKU9_9CORY|nr:hypothetical protein [Corynebacterium halotolerans]AGF72003.1 hypothetical protein A605_04985 [Corynebacterium halotolerans YIM 70093 = DSM 44683]
MPRTTTMTRRLLTGFAAASLTLGLAACASVEDDTRLGDDSPEQTGAAHTTPEGADTANPGDITTVTDTTAGVQDEGAGGSQDTGDPQATEEGAEGDTQEIDLVDGSSVAVPVPLAEAINTHSADFGTPTGVEEGSDGRYLVSYEEDSYLAYSADTGAQPLIGMIAQTWMNEGGLDSDLGLPTGPEEAIPDGEGWTQEFTNGTISWVPAPLGDEYTSEIEQN